MELAMLAFVMNHLGLITLLGVGILGIAIQQNLGTFNLNAWQQVMQLSGSQVNTDATVGAHVLAGNVMVGFGSNFLFVTAAGAVNITTRTANQLWLDFVNFVGQIPGVGMNWEFEIINTGGGTVTLVGGTGVTIVGTATVVNTANRTWLVVYNGGGPNNATFSVTNLASRSN